MFNRAINCLTSIPKTQSKAWRS